MKLLEEVRTAVRVSTTAYDGELSSLIEAAKIDIHQANVEVDEDDPITRRAIVLYCRLYFGSPEDFNRLKEAYDEVKMQLGMATGYKVVDEA